MKANSVSTPDNNRLLPKSITTHSFSLRLSVTQRVFGLESNRFCPQFDSEIQEDVVNLKGTFASLPKLISPFVLQLHFLPKLGT